MTLNEINVEELYAKEEFVAALNAVTSPEDVKQVLAKENITVSDEEAKEIYNGVSNEMGELSEDALDNVNGGSVGKVLAAIIAAGAAGAAVTVGSGVLIVGGVVFAGAAALTAYNTYKKMKSGK